MDAYNYTWHSSLGCAGVPNDDGVRIFLSVLFNRLGVMSLVATDTADGTITGQGWEIQIMKQTAPAQRIRQIACAVTGQHHQRFAEGFECADLWYRDLIFRKNLQQESF